MSSVIDLVVLSEHGERLSTARVTVDYGDEQQRVIVVLSDPAMEHSGMDMTARDALNESMAEQLAMIEGYDA